MKPKAFLFALLASVLLVLLVAACGGDDDGGSSDIGDPEPCFETNDLLNALYSPKSTVLAKKNAEFENYPAEIHPLSEVTELMESTLKASIEQNLISPYGVRYQLYNYVITTNCKIFVATWTKSDGPTNLLACEEGRSMPIGRNGGTMINFFPEDLGSQVRAVNEDARQSPCWLPGNAKNGFLSSLKALFGLAQGEKKGLLDGLSKHFMLAQGPGKSIAAFPTPDDLGNSPWGSKEVAYAGEIVVDLGSCTYSLNSHSGTYKPRDEDLPNATRFFAKKVSNDSLKISGVEPWCPSD